MALPQRTQAVQNGRNHRYSASPGITRLRLPLSTWYERRFEARVAVSPGVGFGRSGDGFVRFALVENDERIRQAIRGIRKVMEATDTL